jgi:MFS family permease
VSNNNARLLAFGFALTFLSSFGQTFFIGLFSEELRTAAQLGQGTFGTLYSAATLTSAVCVFWAGALIDRIALPAYATGSALLLALGCLLLTLAEQVVWLGIALFLLRIAGQGLFSHTAVTATARFFERNRGKALAIVLLGHPVAEALLPIIAVLITASAGWRVVWMLAAAVVVATIPLLACFGAQPNPRSIAVPVADVRSDMEAALRPRDASRREVLRDRRFHLLLPTLLLPGFVITGIFIHQARLVAEKGWALPWFAACFVVFAAAQVAAMLGAGPLIDRLTARHLAPFYLVPLGAACVVINLTDDRLIAVPFMAGAGLTTGAAASIAAALWAELYGVKHLGAIRALAVSTMIMSTALAPAIFGWLLEAGVRFGTILFVCAGAVAAAIVMARAALGSERNARSDA